MFSLKSLIVGGVLLLGLVGCGATDEQLLREQGDDPLAELGAGPDGGTLESCKPGKALICHIPPGNPSNAHTLCVGQPAVSPHLRLHGDYEGSCVRSADGGLLLPDGGIVEGDAPGKGDGSGSDGEPGNGPGEGSADAGTIDVDPLADAGTIG